MTRRLKIGVVGLGRLWARRYAPALATLSELYEIVAVCDQIPHRTAAEAARLRCRAAGGAADLVADDAVEAVVLVDAQWFGLWPLGRAARLGKPVFCAGSLERDAAHAEALRDEAANGVVRLAWEPGATPAARRLPQLVSERLGAPRLVVAERTRRRGDGPGAVSGLLTWLFALIGTEPERVLADERGPAGFATTAFACAGGRVVQLSGWRGGGPPTLRVRVVGKQGEVLLTSPRRLAWRDAAGRGTLTLPRGPKPTVTQLKTFHAEVVAGTGPRGIEAARRALKLAQGTNINR